MARERHGLDRRRPQVDIARVEDSGSTRTPVDRRGDDDTQLIDKAGPQQRPVRPTAALQHDPLDAELAMERFERAGKIDLGRTGEDVGDAIGAQPRQMPVGNRFRQHDQDRIAADILPRPNGLALAIEEDAPGFGIATRKPVRARKNPVARRVLRLGTLGEFLRRDTAAQPRPAAPMFSDKLIVQAFEQVGHYIILRPPAAAPDPPVDARDHVANDIRFHARQLSRNRTVWKPGRLSALPVKLRLAACNQAAA